MKKEYFYRALICTFGTSSIIIANYFIYQSDVPNLFANILGVGIFMILLSYFDSAILTNFNDIRQKLTQSTKTDAELALLLDITPEELQFLKGKKATFTSKEMNSIRKAVEKL